MQISHVRLIIWGNVDSIRPLNRTIEETLETTAGLRNQAVEMKMNAIVPFMINTLSLS